jgi:hypothetical protein
MKKIFPNGLILFFGMILLSNPSFSQLFAPLAYDKPAGIYEMENKVSSNKSELTKISGTKVNSKTLKSFIDYFSDDVPNVNWYMQGNNYLADFWQNGKWTKAFFTQKGNFICSFGYGTEANLPKDIRLLIKSNYADYNIGRVAEIYTSNKVTYVINLDNEDRLIQVKVIDGKMEEMFNSKKTK